MYLKTGNGHQKTTQMLNNQVTIFKNIRETEAPFFRGLSQVLERVKLGATKDIVQGIRVEKRKHERNELKKQLPAICFSGTFSKRADSSLIDHSGIICLDFDGYEKQKELLQDKERLSKSEYALSVFISPSGNGLKVLVKIPPKKESHTLYFNSLEKHFNSVYFDKTSKNISRVCYESFDPLIYINNNSSVWDRVEDVEYKEVSNVMGKATIPITDENKIVEILVKWWEKKYPMAEGQRNHSVYILAMAFNDFGIDRSLASYIINQYSSSDFTIQEIATTINSAYRNVQNFKTKHYEDEEKINSIRVSLSRGISKKEIKFGLEEFNITSELADRIIEKIEAEKEVQVFWTKNDKGVIRVAHILFKQFLEEYGYYKYCPEGSKNYVFVKVTNNLVDNTTEKEIKDFVLAHLIDIEDTSIYNYFADNTRFFKDEFLSLLSTIDIYFIEDSKDTAYLYYRNCAVKITTKKIHCVDYLDLGGYVWKDHVIDRDFNINEIIEDCDYRKFISNICGGNEGRINTMESTIGFLLHGFKDLSFCPAVILNDEVISDNPEGGTGKGLFMNALGKMKKIITIDGKSFTFERNFAYQLVSADTQVLVFDDVKKYFDFERLFSVVTEGITLEKKNKDAVKIPFNKSPKITITTNYAIKGAGNSFARRKWELELHQHYNKGFTPLDEFGKLMFSDWSDEEWSAFDNYMLNNLQSYLNTGLVKSEFVNLNIRQLSAETSHDFIDWCGLVGVQNVSPHIELGVKLYKNELYFDFIEEHPDYGPKAKMTISRTKFYKWLISYASYKGCFTPEEGRDTFGRWIIIEGPKKLETIQTEIF